MILPRAIFPLRETWVSTKLGSGLVTVGQFKPYRGMEELTSSNEITLMERPSTSSTGIYNGRQFLMGMGYKRHDRGQVWLWRRCHEPGPHGLAD